MGPVWLAIANSLHFRRETKADQSKVEQTCCRLNACHIVIRIILTNPFQLLQLCVYVYIYVCMYVGAHVVGILFGKEWGTFIY